MATSSSPAVGFTKKHRKFALQRFTKILHTFGVNVKEHSEKLGIEESELKDFEAEIGNENLFRQNEKHDIVSVLGDLTSLLLQIESVELVIKNELNHYLTEARNYASSLTDLRILGALKELHTGLHRRMATKLKVAIPDVRAYIMHSFDVEAKKVFSAYRLILRRAEKAVFHLHSFEQKIPDEETRARREFLRLSNKIRRIIHISISDLTRDICRAYDLRARLYSWLISADKQMYPRLNENLEKEYEQMAYVKTLYLQMYNEHMKSIFQIYFPVVRAVKR